MHKDILSFRSAFQLLLMVGLSMAISSCTTGSQQGSQGTSSAEPSAESTGNVQQEFPLGGEPSLTRNFYFVFDGSGSMDEELNGTKKIDGAKKAVQEFMKSMPDDVNLDDVNLGLYVFCGQGRGEVLSLGLNKKKVFLEAINQVEAGNRTPLGQSIEIGAKKLEEQRAKQLGYGEYHLVVVTDGEATDNLSSGVKYAVSRGISIHAIGLGIGENHELNNPNYVVSYVAANDFAQLTKALVEAVQAESEKFDATDF